jgi:hypothetical protein
LGRQRRTRPRRRGSLRRWRQSGRAQLDRFGWRDVSSSRCSAPSANAPADWQEAAARFVTHEVEFRALLTEIAAYDVFADV